jgi:hypothetical protein
MMMSLGVKARGRMPRPIEPELVHEERDATEKKEAMHKLR